MARKILVTSNHYSKPYRPLPIAVFNRTGRLLEKVGALPDLSVTKLVAAARRKTGLQDLVMSGS